MVVTSWLPWIERPRSPVRACLSQIRYCTTNGSSRLYCSRIAARVSGDAWRDPTNARAGSPGARFTSAKTPREIRRMSGIATSNRRST